MKFTFIALMPLVVGGCALAPLFADDVFCDDDVPCPDGFVCGAGGVCVESGDEGEGEGGDNTAPVADDDAVNTSPGREVRIVVLRNDTDADGDTLDVEIASAPAGGDAEVSGDDVVYTPDAATRGADSFSYSIDDGNGGSDTATVTVTIVVQPLRLTTTSLPAADQATAYSTTLQATGGVAPYRFTSTELPAGFSLSTGGVLTATPATAATLRFDIVVTDADDTTVTTEVSLTVRADNTAPAAAALSAAYAGAVDELLIEFAAPGDDNNAGRAAAYELRRSRTVIDAGNFDVATVVDLAGAVPRAAGAAESLRVDQPWYDGVFHYALKTSDSSGNASVSADLVVDTNARAALDPDIVDFGDVAFAADGANVASLDVDVVADSASLVDVVVDVDGVSVDAAAFSVAFALTALAPGDRGAITIRFAPDAVADFDGVLTVEHDSGAITADLTGAGVNVAPVVVASGTVLASLGAVTTLTVNVDDDNGAADVAGVVADLSAVGGGSAVALTAAGGAFTTTFTATGTAGARVIPVVATDATGATGAASVAVVVFAGTAREVGAGKAFADIKSAITAAATGELIAVFPGTYTGANNKNLALGGKVLSIVGLDGADATVVDCEGVGRAFNLTDGSGSTIAGLTFRNCVASAVRSVGIDLTVSGCLFENNSVSDVGGGIFFDGIGADLTLRDSVFRDNDAPVAGAGVAVREGASAVIEDCDFSGNVVGLSGAALHITGGNTAVRRSTFSSNEAALGAAIAVVVQATITIEDCFFEENRSVAGAFAPAGGALLFETGTAANRLIVGSTFLRNSSDGSGGAIFAEDVTIRDCVFDANDATEGRAVALSRSIVEDSEFKNMSRDVSGAAIRSIAPCTYRGLHVHDNAGTIFFLQTASIEDSIIENNTSATSHSTFLGQSGQPVMRLLRTTLRNNVGVGGGVGSFEGNNTLVDSCIFDGNRSTNFGGAFSVQAFGSTGIIDVKNSLFTGNSARNGGALLLADTTATITNSTFSGNEADDAVLLVSGSTAVVTVRDSIVFGNDGDALAIDANVQNSAIVNIDHCIAPESGIDDPTLRINGGAGYVAGASGNLDVDPLFNNVAAKDFRLKVSPASPGINAGSRSASAAGLSALTATSDNAADGGVVDLGFHVSR